MSLRWLLALLLGAALVVGPTINVALLSIFPPPLPAFMPAPPCLPGQRDQGPCVHSEEGGEPRPGLIGPRRSFLLGERLSTMPNTVFALHEGPEPRLGEFRAIRSHLLWINLASFGIVLAAAVLIFTVVLRWPIRGLLTAIEDIEHGAVPAAGGMAAPSELRQIGRALHRLAKQLRAGTQERELMLAGMSHDLRSPLARIQAAIELRARPGEDWQPVLRDVREIDHIIGQCIDYVRDGQDEPLTQEVLDELVCSAVRDDDEVQLDLAASVATPMRRQSMLRLIRNLLDNARAHGAPPVTLRTWHEADALVLSVEDGGAGIEPAQWERLCAPFAQGARARHPGGAGLGLAIVQRVADRHGATLHVRARSDTQPFAIELRLPR